MKYNYDKDVIKPRFSNLYVNCLLVVLLVFSIVLWMPISYAESKWDCTNCGNIGNTGNFCPECGAKKSASAENMNSHDESFLVCDCLEWSISKKEAEAILGKPAKEVSLSDSFTLVLYQNQKLNGLNSRTVLIFVNNTLQAALLGVIDNIDNVQSVLAEYYSDKYGEPGNVDYPLITKSFNLLMSNIVGEEYTIDDVKECIVWQPLSGTGMLLDGADCMIMNLDYVAKQGKTESASEPITFTISPGEYIVGEDFPAGTYTITTKGFMVVLNVFKNVSKFPYADPQFILDSKTPVGKLKLNNVQLIEIVGGNLTFDTYRGIK